MTIRFPIPKPILEETLRRIDALLIDMLRTLETDMLRTLETPPVNIAYGPNHWARAVDEYTSPPCTPITPAARRDDGDNLLLITPPESEPIAPELLVRWMNDLTDFGYTTHRNRATVPDDMLWAEFPYYRMMSPARPGQPGAIMYGNETLAASAARLERDFARNVAAYVRKRLREEERAAYVAAVTAAVNRPEGIPDRVFRCLTQYCTECGEIVNLDDADHVVIESPHSDQVFVLVGCKGHWFVDPNAVGIPSPGWTDATGNTPAAVAATATTTHRKPNLLRSESQRVLGLSLIHDGNHWTGSFLVAVRRMLDDLVVNEEPLHITVYVDDDDDVSVGARTDSVMRVTGKAVTVNEDVITFDDGATVEIERVISLHI